MTLPYAEPLTLIDPADIVVPEPPRRGEPGHTVHRDLEWLHRCEPSNQGRSPRPARKALLAQAGRKERQRLVDRQQSGGRDVQCGNPVREGDLYRPVRS